MNVWHEEVTPVLKLWLSGASEQSYKQWGSSVEEQEAVKVETQMMIGADWEKFKVILGEHGIF